jgi:hypothetical protein
MNTAAFATVLVIYTIVLYLAQSPVSRNRRNRIAFNVAIFGLAASFFFSAWLLSRMGMAAEPSLAIVLGCVALMTALGFSRILFVSLRTGRQLARGVVYDRHINPNMYSLGMTFLIVIVFGSALLWLWAVARSLGWK